VTCGQARALLQAFVDEELGAAAAAEVAAHLRGCATCRAAHDERRSFVAKLAAALPGEGGAPAGLARAVAERVAQEPASRSPLRRLFAMRSFRIAFSAATLLVAGAVALWLFAGQDLAFARAIDKAIQSIQSAHFVAVEGGRTVEVWATPDAERVQSEEGWMVATDGRAYLFEKSRKRVVVTDGAMAHLKLLRGLNVLLLSERLRGRALGKPTVEKQTVTLDDGRKAIRITASGKAKHEGVVCTFRGTMVVDAATNLILSGEATETVPNTPQAQRLVRQGKLRSLRVEVDSVEYNTPIPAGTFDTTTPKGWTVVHH
jgi:hypothetical protein